MLKQIKQECGFNFNKNGGNSACNVSRFIWCMKENQMPSITPVLFMSLEVTETELQMLSKSKMHQLLYYISIKDDWHGINYYYR